MGVADLGVLVAALLSVLLATLPVQGRHLSEGPQEDAAHAPVAIAGTSRPAYVHRPVPHGYDYEGNVTFTSKLMSGPLPLWSLAHVQGADASARSQAPASHRTVLVTRDGRRFTKSLTLNSHRDGVFGEPRIPAPAQEARQAAAEEVSTEGRSLLQAGMVNTNTFNCVGCPSGGPDTRTLVQDTSAFPYSAIGQLMGQVTANTALECTGTLIGTRHVLTAGHCVYDIHSTHKMVSSLDFAPGMNGHGKPNGVVQWQNVRILSQFQGQSTYSTTAINYDFALITLISDVSPALGYFGIERGTGDVTYDIKSAGYPADKTTGSMWSTSCNGVEYDYGHNQGVFKDVSQCANNACANILQHTCVASEGQSGAGMWDTASRKLHSILTGKLSTTEGNSYYVGTKMDAFVYDTLNAWYQEDMGTGIPAEDSAGGNAAIASQPASQGAAAAAAGASAGGSASAASATPRPSGGGAGAFPGLGGRSAGAALVARPSRGGISLKGGQPTATSTASATTTSSPSPPAGLFGGLLSGLNSVLSTSPTAANTTIVTSAAGTAPAPAPGPQPNAIADAQPTALLTPLITTNGGVSLVFDPLIRKPSEVAAAIVNNIASGVNSGGR